MGTEFLGSSGAVASLEKGTGVSTGVSQTKSILLSPSTVLTATLSPSVSSVKTSAQSSIHPLAVSPGDPLDQGMKFRVIAYRSADGNYQDHKDYTVGQPAASMVLDAGVNYNFIAYSYGNALLPDITPGELNNLSGAVINYDNNNPDLMYQNISFTPTYSNNDLRLNLRHKLTQITTTINAGAFGNIGNITNPLLGPHYTEGTFNLSTGKMESRANPVNL
ncbi:hypothetical protein CMU93_17995, partial [Elizabethkingia anophelis]|nr:hypothetical protein [Elizabethkingia anophelis]